MSRQLAISAAFSVFMMTVYVLFGADTARVPLVRGSAVDSPVQISAPALPKPTDLFPSLR